jgi:hypothetical protein
MPSLEQAVQDAVQDAASEQGAEGVIADDLPAVGDEAEGLVPAGDDS